MRFTGAVLRSSQYPGEFETSRQHGRDSCSMNQINHAHARLKPRTELTICIEEFDTDLSMANTHPAGHVPQSRAA